MHIPNYRRNFWAFLGDYVWFGLAMTFASATTVLPDFISRLTQSELVVGLFTAAHSGAWLLPQIFFARFLTSQRRKKPFVILGASLGRPLYLIYALLLGLGWLQKPVLAVGLLFIVQTLFMGTDALAAVAWFDMLAKAIPEERRGRLVGSSQLVRGLLAFGAGGIIALLLGEKGPPFPQNYASLIALAGGCLLASLLSLSFVVEPEEPVMEERISWRDYLPQLADILQKDAVLRRLMIVRLLAGFDGLALSFYILFALQKLGLGPETVGLFTAVQILGGIIGSIGLGLVGDRVGPHRVVQISTGLGLLAPLLGLALFLFGRPDGALITAVYALIFIFVGIVQNAVMLGFFNYVLALAPPGQRPSYIGLLNTFGGLLLLAPPLGGWLLQWSSYGVLFGLTAGIVLTSHLLSWRLPSARGRHRQVHWQDETGEAVAPDAPGHGA
ncbi:MAG: MFS transporter [Chloroflexia bacterium]|nr:MFS transporter [Chloroflexia bacterium]